MKYFAYGSNCNPKVMSRKGVAFSDRRRGTLSGFKILFNKKALREELPDEVGFANIEPAEGGTVEGILYEIAEEHLELLDRSERYPEHYEHITVRVETDAGIVESFAYRAQPDKTADGLKPSRNYLNHILSGQDFLSRQYYEALDKTHTYQGDCAICSRKSEVVFIRDSERLHMLCQPCRDTTLVWGDARGRALTIPEARAVMTELVIDGPGLRSIRAIIDAAIEARFIDP